MASPAEKAGDWLATAEHHGRETSDPQVAALLGVGYLLVAIADELHAITDELRSTARATYNLAGP